MSCRSLDTAISDLSFCNDFAGVALAGMPLPVQAFVTETRQLKKPDLGRVTLSSVLAFFRIPVY